MVTLTNKISIGIVFIVSVRKKNTQKNLENEDFYTQNYFMNKKSRRIIILYGPD